MAIEDVGGLLEEYSRKSYVERTALISSAGVPIAGNDINDSGWLNIATLVSLTYEGAYEIAGKSGYGLTQLSLEFDNDSRIVIRSLDGRFILVVQLKRYDDKIGNEIVYLSKMVSKSI